MEIDICLDTITKEVTDFLRVFVWNIFIRKLFTFNHFQFIRAHLSSFIPVNKFKKNHKKTTVAFE